MKIDLTLELLKPEHTFNPECGRVYLHALLAVLFTCLLVLFSNAGSASESQPGEEHQQKLLGRVDKLARQLREAEANRPSQEVLFKTWNEIRGESGDR